MLPTMEENFRRSPDIRARVNAALPTLSPALAEVVRAVADEGQLVARLSITDFAKRVGTSEATVVRAARALGFTGYAQLRLAIAASEGARPSRRLPITEDIDPSDPLEAVLAKLVVAEQGAIEQTGQQLDVTVAAAAIDALVAARRVQVYGVAASGLIAADIAQKLARIDIAASAYADVHLATTGAALVKPGDVVLAVSYSGETIDVLKPLELAKRNGAVTIGITCHAPSSLSKLVDFPLVAAKRDTELRPGALASRIAQLLIVDLIFVGVAQRTYERTTAALQATRDALDPYRNKKRQH